MPEKSNKTVPEQSKEVTKPSMKDDVVMIDLESDKTIPPSSAQGEFYVLRDL